MLVSIAYQYVPRTSRFHGAAVGSYAYQRQKIYANKLEYHTQPFLAAVRHPAGALVGRHIDRRRGARCATIIAPRRAPARKTAHRERRDSTA